MKRFSVLVAAGLLVVSCGPKAPQEEAAPPPGPSAASPSPSLFSAFPWSVALQGQTVAAAFPKQIRCIGYVDGPVERNAQSVRVIGWGWDQDHLTPLARVIVTDEQGKIVGFGEGGMDRQDVSRGIPEITSPKSGWAAILPTTPGAYKIYGLGGDNTACSLGEFRLEPQ